MANHFSVSPIKKITGTIVVPGDKSISHRALMFGAIAEGKTNISGLLKSDDVLATMKALQQLNVSIVEKNDVYIVDGRGLRSLKAAKQSLDMGNSGTSIRLLTGILSAQHFDSTLTGDESLQKRPMRRILDPLKKMGADISLSKQDTAPIHIRAIDHPLHSINYVSPIASAQVKSCFLLANLYAEGESTFSEPALSRDHTERMLKAFGCSLEIKDLTIKIKGQQTLKAIDIEIPGDFSSAAFFMVLATIVPDSEITIKNVGINPTRIGLLTILKLMGANIELQNEKTIGNEPVADICVKTSALHGIEIPVDLIASTIDEFPVLFIAAACAKGRTVLRQAEELRFKESDRITAMLEGLKKLGIAVEEFSDGAAILGGTIQGDTVIDSMFDHRIAMAFAIAGAKAIKPIEILNCDNVATSFPDFVMVAKQLGMNIQIHE